MQTRKISRPLTLSLAEGFGAARRLCSLRPADRATMSGSIIFQWLERIGLGYAVPTFQAMGITSPQSLMSLTFEDYDAVGVTDLNDRKVCAARRGPRRRPRPRARAWGGGVAACAVRGGRPRWWVRPLDALPAAAAV